MIIERIVSRFRVTDGDDFRLKDFKPGDTCDLDLEKSDARHLLEAGVNRLRGLQERLYARRQWSVLIILQAMDTAGKDGVIEHVMSGVNPQGCMVHSFKAPSAEQLAHDFLWRAGCRLPERGQIGIFNRSYYEEALVVRVHENLLQAQGLPPGLIGKDIWKERFDSIRSFEKHLARNGTLVLKFFLNVSKDEQKKRLLARIDDPAKHWKFSPSDLSERQYWDDYQRAYQKMIAHTASEQAPWHVVPANNKWFTRLVVAATIIDALGKLDLDFPEVSDEARADMAKAREQLLAEGGGKSD